MRFFLWATQKQALGNRHQREVGSNGSWLRHCLRDQGTRKQQSSAMWTTIQFGYFYQSIILLFVQAALVYSFLNDTNSSAWVLLPCSFNYIYMHKFFLSVLSSEALHMRALRGPHQCEVGSNGSFRNDMCFYEPINVRQLVGWPVPHSGLGDKTFHVGVVPFPCFNYWREFTIFPRQWVLRTETSAGIEMNWRHDTE